MRLSNDDPAVLRLKGSGTTTAAILDSAKKAFLPTYNAAINGGIDAVTGNVLWRKKLGAEQRQSTPLYANGLLYVAMYTAQKDEKDASATGADSVANGDLVILRPSREGVTELRPGNYAYFDRSITPLNYLRYTQSQWQRWNNDLLYQNRLRASDFPAAARQQGLEVIHQIQTERKDLLANTSPAKSTGYLFSFDAPIRSVIE